MFEVSKKKPHPLPPYDYELLILGPYRIAQEAVDKLEKHILGASIRYRVCVCVCGGGGWSFCLAIFIFHRGRGKLYFFHLRIDCISTMLCGHLFISPIFPTNRFIFKTLQAIPGILMVAIPS